MSQLTLSLFPGIGLLDMAFEQEGFCVVRGPDVLWGGDVRRFHPPSGKFDGIIGGPPCQTFSSLAHLVRAGGREPKFGNLIPEYERCVLEAQPAWFLMENVPQAPEPIVPGYGVKSFLLDNSCLCDGTGFGLEQRWVRRFSFGMRGVTEPPSLLRWVDLAVFLLPDAPGLDRLTVQSGGGPGPNSRDKRRSSTITSLTPNNTQEAKHRVSAEYGGHMTNEALVERRRQKRRASDGTGSDGGPSIRMGRYKLHDACRLQGLPEDFLKESPFTADGKLKAVANGVPLPMGKAIARAILRALEVTP